MGGELILRNEKEKSIYSAFISYEGLNGIMIFSKLVKNFQLTLQQFRIDLISNLKTKMQKNFNILQNREKLHTNEPLVTLSLGNIEPVIFFYNLFINKFIPIAKTSQNSQGFLIKSISFSYQDSSGIRC